MADVDVVRRVEMLEKNVESLQRLPSQMGVLTRRVGRVESQILQLRTEMRFEFSAIRSEMAAFQTATREEFAAVRHEMASKQELAEGLHSLREELRADIAGMGRELAIAVMTTYGELAKGQAQLRDQIADLKAELRRPR